MNPEMKPDLIYNLEKVPLPFEDNSVDEIHAYHVLEHTGTQGDFRFFFAQFEDFWRILKPDAMFYGIVPSWNQEWAWGDPGHKRVITPGTLAFLDQTEYAKQVGHTAMCDYRAYYKGNFKRLGLASSQNEFEMWFVLKAIKN
jgi:hypothetical protein